MPVMFVQRESATASATCELALYVVVPRPSVVVLAPAGLLQYVTVYGWMRGATPGHTHVPDGQ